MRAPRQIRSLGRGGGLFGALAGALLSKDARQHPLRTVFIGILAAIVVCVAHAIGVSTQTWGTPSGSSGEAVFFFIAAVAGYLGRGAMAKLVPA